MTIAAKAEEKDTYLPKADHATKETAAALDAKILEAEKKLEELKRQRALIDKPVQEYPKWIAFPEHEQEYDEKGNLVGDYKGREVASKEEEDAVLKGHAESVKAHKAKKAEKEKEK